MKEGQLVIIKECHKIPDLVGQTAEVVVTNGLQLGSKYPIHVVIEGYENLVGFREDELTVIGQG
jgi:hypothetical protein